MLAQPQIRIVEISIDIQYLLPISGRCLVIVSGLCLQTGIDQGAVGSGGKNLHRLINDVDHRNLVFYEAQAHRRAQQTFCFAGASQLIHQVSVRAIDEDSGIISIQCSEPAVVSHCDIVQNRHGQTIRIISRRVGNEIRFFHHIVTGGVQLLDGRRRSSVCHRGKDEAVLIDGKIAVGGGKPQLASGKLLFCSKVPPQQIPCGIHDWSGTYIAIEFTLRIQLRKALVAVADQHIDPSHSVHRQLFGLIFHLQSLTLRITKSPHILSILIELDDLSLIRLTDIDMILLRDKNAAGSVDGALRTVLSHIIRNPLYILKFLVGNDDITIQNDVYFIIPIEYAGSRSHTFQTQLRSVYRPFQFISSRCSNHLAPDVIGIRLCRIGHRAKSKDGTYYKRKSPKALAPYPF